MSDSNRYILILDWCGDVTPHREFSGASPEEVAAMVPDGHSIGRWFVYDTKKKARVKRVKK